MTSTYVSLCDMIVCHNPEWLCCCEQCETNTVQSAAVAADRSTDVPTDGELSSVELNELRRAYSTAVTDLDVRLLNRVSALKAFKYIQFTSDLVLKRFDDRFLVV